MTACTFPDDLRAQQREFAALINANDDPPADAPAVTALLARLTGVAPRLNVYRDAYRVRLVEALRSNYPVLQRVLGDDDFATLGQAYLADHPSREPSIRWFGHRLCEWLDARLAVDPDALPHPALADLARMEWAVCSSFDAADAEPVAHEVLAALAPADWPSLRFAPHPSVRVLRLQWAVEPLWHILTDNEDAVTEPPEALAHDLLVWRRGLDSRFRSLEADEADALAACLGGMRFDALCGRVAETSAADAADAVAGRVVAWLSQWVATGLLVSVPTD
ncbi:MAG: DNA-binding domain-containing protein [Betaproteobacteria bacterium]